MNTDTNIKSEAPKFRKVEDGVYSVVVDGERVGTVQRREVPCRWKRCPDIEWTFSGEAFGVRIVGRSKRGSTRTDVVEAGLRDRNREVKFWVGHIGEEAAKMRWTFLLDGMSYDEAMAAVEALAVLS